MDRWKTLLITLTTAIGITANALPEKVNKARLADRIALSLTNSFPDPEIRQKFVTGEMSIGSFVNSFKESPQTFQALTKYWMKVFGIGQVDVKHNKIGLTYRKGGGYQYELRSNYIYSKYNWRRTTYLTNPNHFGKCSHFDFQLMGAHEPKWWRASNESQVAARNETLRLGACGQIASNDPLALSVRTAYSDNARKAAEGVLPLKVNPWWSNDPNFTVKVFPKIVEPEHCGPRLKTCYPPASHGAKAYRSFVENEAFGMEPGAIAAHVITQDHPWSDVINSKDTVMTGRMAHWLERWGAPLYRYAPPGTWNAFATSHEADGQPKFDKWLASGDPVFEFKDIAGQELASVVATPWKRIARGGANAGVLTTPAFQLSYNGHRAKATAALKAFHCRAFSALPDSVQTPSQEPDLTKRPYCRDCHATLEPLAGFWARWADRARINFDYYSGAPHSNYPRFKGDAGMFLGKSGNDLPALAEILTSTDDFDTCASYRVFEFVFRRDPTLFEKSRLLPRIKETYLKSGKRMWPAIVAAYSSSLFSMGVDQ